MKNVKDDSDQYTKEAFERDTFTNPPKTLNGKVRDKNIKDRASTDTKRPSEVGQPRPFPLVDSSRDNWHFARHHFVLFAHYARAACCCAVGLSPQHRSSDLFHTANPHANVHAVPDPYAHVDNDGNTHPHQHTGADLDAIDHLDANPDAHGEQHAHGHLDLDANGHTNQHANADEHPDLNAQRDGNGASGSGTGDDRETTDGSTKKNTLADFADAVGCTDGNDACGSSCELCGYRVEMEE